MVYVDVVTSICLREDMLSIKKDLEGLPESAKTNHSDLTHLKFAAHIAEQNRLRSRFFNDLTLGDPVWDILLDIYVSEKTDKPTTIDAISNRLETPISLCSRCIDYLLERDAVFVNRNRYMAPQFLYLASEKTKKQVAAWLNNCLASVP